MIASRRFYCVSLALAIWSVTSPAALIAHPGSGIEVDDEGRVFFTDTMRGLWRVDGTAQPILVHTDGLHWITIDRAGSFAQAPERFGPFSRLTPRGEKPAIIACGGFPCTVARDGNLYWPREHSLNIIRRTPQGEESVLVTAEKFTMTGDVGVPGITCGPDGDLYLAVTDGFNRNDSTGQHAIWRVHMNGQIYKFAEDFLKRDVWLPKEEQLDQVPPNYCRGITVTENGDVYVAMTGNRCVMKVTARGDSSIAYKTEKPWSPTGVALLDGSLYVLEYDEDTPVQHGQWPPRVKKVTRDSRMATLAVISRE